MICILTVIRYPKYLSFFGLLSMALFHLSLFMKRNISFYKLLGCGKNGSFDITPDWRQWAILRVESDYLYEQNNIHNITPFINFYIKLFRCNVQTIVLKPISSHGSWDGKKCFGSLPNFEKEFTGKIAVLTRATIRLSKLQSFWKNVPVVSSQMKNANGLIMSIGIGEVPLVKQATFSIWENVNAMKNFAYSMKEHQTVIKKTRKENWYSEEMFTRFEIINISTLSTL